jgi:hypothetical protein
MSNSLPLFSKKKLGLAGLAAFGACATCCAVPLLAAAGIGGGLLSSLAGYIRPGAELMLAALVGGGVLGAMVIRGRGARAADGETSCAGGCGCGPANEDSAFRTPAPAPAEAIVCTADLRDQPTIQGQLDGYRAAFEHLVRCEWFAGGVRWVFEKRAGLLAELRTLAEKEHQCCKFFQFDLRESSSGIVWETTARAEAAAVLQEFGRRPERLREQPQGRDVDAIKARVTRAGLSFAADVPAAK